MESVMGYAPGPSAAGLAEFLQHPELRCGTDEFSKRLGRSNWSILPCRAS